VESIAYSFYADKLLGIMYLQRCLPSQPRTFFLDAPPRK
jgi:hypothetical protein